MKISIHQPAYLPWLGYIEKIKNSHQFIFLDTVQYAKRSFDNRNSIPIDGKNYWLSIPIKTTGRFNQTYCQAMPVDNKWIENHLKTIKYTFGKAKYFDKFFPPLKEKYDKIEIKDSLADICYKLLSFFLDVFRIKTPIIRASKLKVAGRKSDLILNYCREMRADQYYSGIAGKDYLDEKSFKHAGIEIIYQTYKPKNHYSSIYQLFIEGPSL